MDPSKHQSSSSYEDSKLQGFDIETIGESVFSRVESCLKSLEKSEFRSAIALNAKDRSYLERLSESQLLAHTRRFISQRLAPATPKRDGKQTPWNGHPVFVAQHATATCCRGCLEKWHGVPRRIPLSQEDIEFAVLLIFQWLALQRCQTPTTEPFSEPENRYPLFEEPT